MRSERADTSIETTLITIEVRNAAIITSSVMLPGGQPASVKSSLSHWLTAAASMTSAGVDDESDQPESDQVEGQAEQLDHGPDVGVDDAEDRGQQQQLPPVARELDVGHELNRGDDSNRVDQDADDELEHRGPCYARA